MENQVSQNYRRYYLSEFSLYDSDHFITFNIVDINTERQEITVAITNEGGISVCTFELITKDGLMYFEYGVSCEEIAIDDFEEVEEEQSNDKIH